MKYIELRVYIKDEWDIEEIAEEIKDMIYNYDEDITPIKDVTYEIIEDKH